ncbi:MAG: N-6 DNA methylase [Bacteroidetes bacterium]|nr:N-6 DNA methylase [Bacteroidota bacterium]
MASKTLNDLLIRLQLRKPSNNGDFEDCNIAFKSHDRVSFRQKFSLDLASKLESIGPEAVYYYNKQPLILFFDFTNTDKTELQSKRDLVFRQAWCLDKSPVVFFIGNGGIEIFNAFRYQKNVAGNGELEKIELEEAEIYKRFSFWELESGKTWEWADKSVFNKNIENSRVNQVLFRNIQFASEKLNSLGLSNEFSNLLILRLIFCRYLIDRGVEFNAQYLKGKTIKERQRNFNEIIGDEQELIGLFNYLKNRFNGNLFVTADDEKLKVGMLRFLSGIFSGTLPNHQPFLFDIFDFSIIPVEIISGIYESVITQDRREKLSAVYTPTFLVDYVLERTLSSHLDKSREKTCKILDPSCGSGIFLVQAYRRMVERHLTISDEILISILVENIYGIDRDANALNVAVFSMYIALLDYKNPKSLIDFKLPRLLGKNLFLADFFDLTSSYNRDPAFEKRQFSFIVGNPPWGRKNSPKEDYHHLNYISDKKLPVAKFEISQSFLYRCADFLAPTSEGCFVITSKALYNQWSDKFKKDFFKKFFIEDILDLSPVRRIIFEGAMNPPAVMRFRSAMDQDTSENIVQHTSLKANLFLKHFRMLVIEKQDRKEIKQAILSQYPWIFKALLYGTEADLRFLQRLYAMKTKIADHIASDAQLVSGDGILKQGKPKDPSTAGRDLLGMSKIQTDHLTDFYFIPNDKIKVTKNDLPIKSGANINQYLGTKLVFKARTKNESEIVASIVDKEAVYIHCTFGIASRKKPDVVHELFTIFKSRLFAYYQFLTSANWGVYIPEIQLTEYLSFPYLPLLEKDDAISSLKESLQVIKKRLNAQIYSESEIENLKNVWYRKINPIVNSTYEIDDEEEDLIDYALEVSRFQFQENRYTQATKPFTMLNKTKLEQYAGYFYDQFSKFYNKEGEYFQVEIYLLNWFVAMKFKLTETQPSKQDRIRFVSENNPERALFSIIARNVSISEISEKIFEQKDVKGFETDFFYIIKPNEFKSWHMANARLDIAEFMDAIRNASLEKLTAEI